MATPDSTPNCLLGLSSAVSRTADRSSAYRRRVKIISDWHLAGRLAEVLYDVSLGETYEVTRDGRIIARITPADVGRAQVPAARVPSARRPDIAADPVG